MPPHGVSEEARVSKGCEQQPLTFDMCLHGAGLLPLGSPPCGGLRERLGIPSPDLATSPRRGPPSAATQWLASPVIMNMTCQILLALPWQPLLSNPVWCLHLRYIYMYMRIIGGCEHEGMPNNETYGGHSMAPLLVGIIPQYSYITHGQIF